MQLRTRINGQACLRSSSLATALFGAFQPRAAGVVAVAALLNTLQEARDRWKSFRFISPISAVPLLRWPAILSRTSGPIVDDDGRELDNRSSDRGPNEDAYSPNEHSPIQQLLNNPTLFDPVRKPRYPIVLCHGLYGFDVRGPAAWPKLQIHYWSNVLDILKRTVGAEVIVTGVPSTGSIESRAEKMHDYLKETAPNRDLNFLAHSMGGLDCRHLISRINPVEYTPVSLTTICTPHRGSPFMDWCTANIGIGALREALEAKSSHHLPYTLKSPLLSRRIDEARDPLSSKPNSSLGQINMLAKLPSSVTTMLLSMLDSPAYSNLTTHFCNNIFNPSTPDRADVRYFSVAARTKRLSVFHPLWLPKVILDETEQAERRSRQLHPNSSYTRRDWGNDGLVSIESAKWGEFLGIMEGCDHWDTRGAQGFSKAWVSGGRNGKGGWAEFFGWKKAQDEKQAGIDPSVGVTLNALGPGTPADDRLPRSQEETAESKARNVDRVKLASAMDWIADHVPTNVAVSALSSLQSSIPLSFSLSDPKDTPPSRAIDDKTRFDIERFYVALSRNLYEEGL